MGAGEQGWRLGGGVAGWWDGMRAGGRGWALVGWAGGLLREVGGFGVGERGWGGCEVLGVVKRC